MVTLLSIDEIAGICHEANRELCHSLGDDSQPAWNVAPQWQQDSAKQSILAIIADPSLTPEQVHVVWSNVKLSAGWKYGPVKDAEKKEHPSLVPYSTLSPGERYKDMVFRSLVAALALPDQACAQ